MLGNIFKDKKDESPEVEKVPGAVVTPEETVQPTDVVPASLEDYPTDGALPHNTNDSLDRIKESEDETNNPIVSEKVKRDKTVDRQEGETQAEYNERVPVAQQPVQPAPTHSYLGAEL